MADRVNRPRHVLLSPEDNVLIACSDLEAGTSIEIDGETVPLPARVPLGHKFARRDLTAGEKILKYGGPIGSTRQAISRGDHVHTHNLASDYIPTFDRQGNEAR